MNCLICGAELNGSICPACGFDLSTCREKYPTLQFSTKPMSSVSFLQYKVQMEASAQQLDDLQHKNLEQDALIQSLRAKNEALIKENEKVKRQNQEEAFERASESAVTSSPAGHSKLFRYLLYAMAILVVLSAIFIIYLNSLVNASLPLKSTTTASQAATEAVLYTVTEKEMSFSDVTSGIYTGTINSDGIPHGSGKMSFSNGDVYEGEWQNGQEHGQGTYTWSSGSVFIGEWVDGERNGNGVMKWINGNQYEGNWVDGCRSGIGTMTWNSGDRYEGEWKDDKRTGQGVYTWPSGATYSGEWFEGKCSGQGTYTWTNGDVFSGEWSAGEREGYGTMIWADGNKYEGDWAADTRTGHGTFTWANGDVFVGEWVDGNRNGAGTLTYADGTVKTGQWKDDEFVE